MGTDNLVAYNSPEEYVAAMREALWDANRPLAIKIAREAIKRFPEHEEIQKFDYVLNPPPPRVVPSDPERRQRFIANHEWLKQHRHEYKNRCVGVLNGELLADAASLNELIDRIGSDNIKGVLLTAIY